MGKETWRRGRCIRGSRQPLGKKILDHLISKPNVLINTHHVLILDLHDTCDLLDAYLHNFILGHGSKSLKLESNTHNLGLYDHHETFFMFVVVCKET